MQSGCRIFSVTYGDYSRQKQLNNTFVLDLLEFRSARIHFDIIRKDIVQYYGSS
jgi:hypothetical protein